MQFGYQYRIKYSWSHFLFIRNHVGYIPQFQIKRMNISFYWHFIFCGQPPKIEKIIDIIFEGNVFWRQRPLFSIAGHLKFLGKYHEIHSITFRARVVSTTFLDDPRQIIFLQIAVEYSYSNLRTWFQNFLQVIRFSQLS